MFNFQNFSKCAYCLDFWELLTWKKFMKSLLQLVNVIGQLPTIFF